MGNHSIETFPRQHLHMPHISYPQLNRANPRSESPVRLERKINLKTERQLGRESRLAFFRARGEVRIIGTRW